MSRLGKICEMVAASNEDTFFDGEIVRDLLAVVKAELTDWPIERHLTWLRSCRESARSQSSIDTYTKLIAAWEALA